MILKIIEKMFRYEEYYRKNHLFPCQLVEKRNRGILPLKEELEKALKKINPQSGSALEETIKYTNDCWPDLFTFINNGYVEITNNAVERAVKPFVIQRKVFQTSGSYAGARYTTKLFSIIQTCKLNNVNVEKYLKYVFNNINK